MLAVTQGLRPRPRSLRSFSVAEKNYTATASTRRHILRKSGAVLGGGMLSGCVGFGGNPEPIMDTSTNEEGGAYEACLIPTGCVSFEEPPETWIAYQYGYGDIGVALGAGDGYLATNRPENYPDGFYDELPAVSFDADSLTDINSGDKEIFFELSPDLLLMDPNNAMVRFDWDRDDIRELESKVAPFFGHFNRRYGYGFQKEYEVLSLMETFEAVAKLFGELDRYEAIAAVHNEVEAALSDRLPPESERPEIALLGGGSDPESGEFALLSALGDGYETKQYRDLGVKDVLADVDGADPWYTTDYEGLLELDPDAVVVHWTVQMSEEEFAAEFVEPFEDHPVGSELSAVEGGRIYRGGTAEQGPIINLFQTEIAAGQLYPDEFGGEELFDRTELNAAIEGDV